MRFVPTGIFEKTKQEMSDVNSIEKADLAVILWKGNDLNEIVYTILQCLSHISEKKYYGITLLMDVLRGASSKKLLSAELDKIEEYGKLSHVARDDLETILEWLITNHFILKTKHPKYPVLHPTYEGTHYKEIITDNKLKKLQALLQKEQL